MITSKPKKRVENGLCVDVESYTDLADVLPVKKDLAAAHSKGVLENTIKVLDILDRAGAKATFFLIASHVEERPDIAVEIERRGHEIGLHGYDHRLLYDMTENEFAQTVEKALTILKKYVSQEIIGYQAPRFSVNRTTLWALEVLIKKGFKYDCSIFPIKHPTYGIEEFSRYPLWIKNDFCEIPMPTLRVLGRNFPFGGGGYFRHPPYLLSRLCFKAYNQSRRPALAYVHPWEFRNSREWMDIFELEKTSWIRRRRIFRNCGENFASKFERLIQDFLFVPVRRVYENLKNEDSNLNP